MIVGIDDLDLLHLFIVGVVDFYLDLLQVSLLGSVILTCCICSLLRSVTLPWLLGPVL